MTIWYIILGYMITTFIYNVIFNMLIRMKLTKLHKDMMYEIKIIDVLSEEDIKYDTIIALEFLADVISRFNYNLMVPHLSNNENDYYLDIWKGYWDLFNVGSVLDKRVATIEVIEVGSSIDENITSTLLYLNTINNHKTRLYNIIEIYNKYSNPITYLIYLKVK